MADAVFRLSSGRRLGYSEFGDPRGAPLFYFHGWPASRLQGEILDPAGKKHGLRVITPDRPGIGLSDYQPERRLLDWPPVLLELADHLGAARFHVLGLSGGGPYVAACAHAMPERLAGAGIIAGAPPLRVVGTGELMWTYKLGLWARRRFPLLLKPGVRVAAWIIGRKFSQWPQTWLSRQLCPADVRAMSDERNHRIMTEAGRLMLLGDVRATRTDGEIYSSDWGFDLRDLKFPIRYWHGDRDANIPLPMARRAAELVPGSTFRVFAGEGHYSLPLLRTEELVRDLLEAGDG